MAAMFARLAVLLGGQGNLDAAAQALEHAIALVPRYADASGVKPSKMELGLSAERNGTTEPAWGSLGRLPSMIVVLTTRLSLVWRRTARNTRPTWRSSL